MMSKVHVGHQLRGQLQVIARLRSRGRSCIRESLKRLRVLQDYGSKLARRAFGRPGSNSEFAPHTVTCQRSPGLSLLPTEARDGRGLFHPRRGLAFVEI